MLHVRGRRGRRQPECREDAAGLGVRLGDLVRRLRVAHQSGPGGHGQVAVEVDVRRADHDRAVDDRGPRGVAAEDRQGGAVVPTALRLVLLDQAAGVLHRAAGDCGGVHRVAQHLAGIAAGAAGEEVLGVDQTAHRLQERPQHLAALVADVAHHLQLLVDDHEELVDLLLVAQELQERPAHVAVRGQPERAADRVHTYGVALHRDVPLGAGTDQVAVTGEEDERPVGAVLALEQPAEDGECPGGVPVGDLGAIVPPDHEVCALSLADLVADDRRDQVGVRRVVDVEASPIGELDTGVVDRVDDLLDGELELAFDLDHDQRRAVVVRVEAALPDLPEGHRDQPVRDVPGLRHAPLERDVEQRLDHPSPPADEPDRLAITGSRRPPDDRPRLVPLERSDGVPGVAGGGHGARIYRRPAAGRGRLARRPAFRLLGPGAPSASARRTRATADHTICSTAA